MAFVRPAQQFGDCTLVSSSRLGRPTIVQLSRQGDQHQNCSYGPDQVFVSESGICVPGDSPLRVQSPVFRVQPNRAKLVPHGVVSRCILVNSSRLKRPTIVQLSRQGDQYRNCSYGPDQGFVSESGVCVPGYSPLRVQSPVLRVQFPGTKSYFDSWTGNQSTP